MVLFMGEFAMFMTTPSGRRRTFVVNIFCRNSSTEILSPASGGTRGSWGWGRGGDRGAEATFVEVRAGRHSTWWGACVAAVSWRIEWTRVGGMLLELHYVIFWCFDCNGKIRFEFIDQNVER